MNLKINIKRPEITKQEIAANKDFGQLLKMYKASVKPVVPFYRSTWFYSGLSAAAALVVAIIIYFEPATHSKRLAYIAPPLEKVKITPSLYSVNTDEGTSITSKGGSVIQIPAKAFVDKSGKTITGKVDVTYRELNDPIDFFLSGIPMNYDSAGVNYTFESAGMIEIHASQLGKELELNPEKELSIALASHQTDKSFNLYHLNIEKKKWEYAGQEEQPFLAKKEEKSDNDASGVSAASSANGNDADSQLTGAEVAATSPQLAAIDSKLQDAELEIKKSEVIVKRFEASRPFEPTQESKGHHRFSVNVSNLKEFPELAIYEDVMFKATDENTNFDVNTYNIDWTDARLNKKGDKYILTLKNADQTASYIVNPAFEGEGYIMAQKIYNDKISQYEEALLERKAAEGEKQQELAAMTEVLKESRQAEAAHAAQPSQEMVNPGNLTFHHFIVHSCGIWNLDKPTLLPQGATIAARFTDEQGKELQFAMGRIYLVEKGRNILFSFSGKSENTGAISYNPEKQNMIWGVTTDNKLAVFSYDKFKAIGSQSGDYTFKMQVSDVDLADETQIEYYLNI